MNSPPKVQFASQVVASKSKYTPLRPQFARHGTSEVASTARDKLGDQAGRADHDLRQLVGHANTLDYLMERLYARQEKNQTSERDTAKAAEQGESSRDAPKTVGFETITEELDQSVASEQASLTNDPGDKLSAIPEEDGERSYFNLPQDKASPGWSVMELLDYESDSYSDDSEKDDADEASDSDEDGSYNSNES